jgi:hypothetical protein
MLEHEHDDIKSVTIFTFVEDTPLSHVDDVPNSWVFRFGCYAEVT